MSKNNDGPNWAPEANDQPNFNRYAPYKEPVTDATILTFGKYKGLKLIDVPASFFIYYKEDATGVKNFWLMEYINENWEAIQKEAKQ